jgi:hypothetical protein
MLDKVSVNLAGQNYTEKTVDATPVNTYSYDGVPVAGAIGFSLLARHFGGMTFDYRRRALYLRDPGTDLKFAGRPEAWGGEALARAKIDDPEDDVKVTASAGAAHASPGGAGAPPEILADGTSVPPSTEQTTSQFGSLPPDPVPSAAKDKPHFRINRKKNWKKTAEAISKHQYYVQIDRQQ